MPEPDFDALNRQLLDSGVSPRFARRTIDELRDHYLDLKSEIMSEGESALKAEISARKRLGEFQVIARHIESQQDLRRWSFRYPALGRIALPLLCVVALPIAPIVAGINHAHDIVRWCAILMVSAVITFGLFLTMQVSISLGEWSNKVGLMDPSRRSKFGVLIR